MPTTAQPPNRIGELDTPPLQRALAHVVLALAPAGCCCAAAWSTCWWRTASQRVPFTQLSNLTGTPSMSVPMHWAAVEPQGPALPFGAQFVARFGDEATLLQLAAQLEMAQPWTQHRAP